MRIESFFMVDLYYFQIKKVTYKNMLNVTFGIQKTKSFLKWAPSLSFVME